MPTLTIDAFKEWVSGPFTVSKEPAKCYYQKSNCEKGFFSEYAGCRESHITLWSIYKRFFPFGIEEEWLKEW